MRVKSVYEILINQKGDILQQIEKITQKINELKHLARTATDPKIAAQYKQEIVKLQGEFKNLTNQAKTFDRTIKNALKNQDAEFKRSWKDKLKTQEDLHKKRINDIETEGKAQKIVDDEEKRRNQEIAREQAQHVAQAKRDQKELERLARQRAQEEKRQQQELIRQDRERLQIYRELGNMMKSVGSGISSAGKTMMGIGVGTTGAITGASKTYTDTFIDLARAVAVKNQGELGGTKVGDWIDVALSSSKATGLDLKSTNQFLEMSLNATSPYYAAKNLDLFSRVGYVTGASGESLGTMNAIYGNRLHRNWGDINQFGDALIAYSDLGAAGQDEMLESLSRISNYTSNFDEHDKYFSMKVMAAISRMLPGSQGLSTGETAIRQMSTDVLKKDLGGTVRQMAKAHGLSLDEYARQFLGVELNGNQLLSTNDLFKADYAKILAGTFKDVLSIEGASLKKNEKTGEVELITSKEIQSDLIKDISGNTRSLTAIYALISAMENGTWDKVSSELNDEAVKGRLDAGEKALDESDVGKLKKSLNSLSVSFMQLISKLAPIMSGFMEKMVELVDWLGIGNMNFEDLTKLGKKLADTVIILTELGIGLFIVGKVISMFGNLITWTSSLTYMMTQMNTAGIVLTGNAGKLFNWLSNSIGISAGNIATGATTAGTSLIALAGKAMILMAAFVAVQYAISDFVSTLQELGKTDTFKTMKEDYYNGVPSPAGIAYDRLNRTAFGSGMLNIMEGNYGEGLKDFGQGFLNGGTALGAAAGSLGFIGGPIGFATVPLGAFLGGLITPTMNAVDATKGHSVNYDDNPWLKYFAYGDYKAEQDSKKEQADAYQEHQGNYEYERKEIEDINSLLDKLPKLDDNYVAFNPDQTYDINDLEGLIEDGTAKGTEKGVKNALSGHFNTPDTYNILGQVGLGQLNQYEDFAVARQGNRTIVNRNNVNININGGNKQEVIDTLNEFFGTTGALSGATDLAFS